MLLMLIDLWLDGAALLLAVAKPEIQSQSARKYR
jgi:hypothetical protein